MESGWIGMASSETMKKRIFIAAHYLEIGGAEISLIGLLNAIDYTRFNVDLFLYAHRGELIPLIPKSVNLLPEIKEYAQAENPIKEALKNGFIGQVKARITAKLKYWLYKRKHHPLTDDAYFQYLENEFVPTLPSLDHFGKYDLAINFIGMRGVVLDKVKARCKATWIHTDLTAIGVNTSLELVSWRRFDYIVSISPDVTRAFTKLFPSLRSKIVEIENILSPEFVRSRSQIFDARQELGICQSDYCVNLLSIGRLCYQKNFENIPFICKQIYEKGIDVHWYIIGYGNDEGLIKDNIARAGMDERVILLGKKSNPYPYIKACDIYVQPSRFEGKSVTVREAQMLCKPVVVTAYPTAKSQIQHNIDGVIVPLDNKGCAEGLASFISNKELQQSIIQYLSTHDYGNETEIEKIYQLIH